MGFGHIACEHADKINTFYEEQSNPYLNFQRPCGVPELKTGQRGRTRRIYKWRATLWEMLRHLPGLAEFVKEDITVEKPDRLADAQSDTQAAIAMQKAKQKLFAGIWERKLREVPRSCGNDRRWTARKTKCRFPSADCHPGNRMAISTFPQLRLATAMEKWKSRNRIPTFPQLIASPKPKHERRQPPPDTLSSGSFLD